MSERTEPRRETRLPFSSPEYKPPTADEFRTVTQLLALTGAQVAQLVGAEDPRTVRRWIGDERAVPYSVWRLLLIDAGLALPDPGEPELGKVAGEPGEIDYAALLKKYIRWIGECEGVDYIDSGSFHHEEEHFSADEWRELKRLAGGRGK